MARIKLENVSKGFNNIKAIDNLSLEVQDGEFFCILGPPGAGKTTLLRLLVGLEMPDQGNIFLDDDLANEVHPSKRDIAMIFQNLALYPDKTVFDNIAFPLRQQKIGQKKIKEKVSKVAKMLKIELMLEKIPSQLSGGERQRVAIGRAIVRQPRAYLMDEPLSNLDALLRLEMRASLKDLQMRLKETFIYVTHDQDEALSMGDRIAVLKEGVLQQIDDPITIYQRPQNIYVATVLGNPPMNFLKCRVKSIDNKLYIDHKAFRAKFHDNSADVFFDTLEGQVILGIRPENIEIFLQNPPKSSIEASIYVTEPLGNETIVDLILGEDVIKAIAAPDFTANVNQKVWIRVDHTRMHLFNYKTQDCIYNTTEQSTVEFAQKA